MRLLVVLVLVVGSKAWAEVVCPACGEEAARIPIVYGLPGQDLMERAASGEIVLGGCLVGEAQWAHRCGTCKGSLSLSGDMWTFSKEGWADFVLLAPEQLPEMHFNSSRFVERMKDGVVVGYQYSHRIDSRDSDFDITIQQLIELVGLPGDVQVNTKDGEIVDSLEGALEGSGWAEGIVGGFTVRAQVDRRPVIKSVVISYDVLRPDEGGAVHQGDLD